MAASIANAPAIDIAYLFVENPEGCRKSAEAAKELGFQSKLANNVEQASIIDDVFAPSEEEVKRAKAVLKTNEETSEAISYTRERS